MRSSVLRLARFGRIAPPSPPDPATREFTIGLAAAVAAAVGAGADPDHFDHWRWNSSVNQELLNGRYWRHLKRDGMMDRLTPADEAFDQTKGASHDRHAAAARRHAW